VEPELVIEPVPQAVPPPVEVTVTVNGVLPAGVDAVVETVSVADVAPLVIVVPKFVVTPVGALGFQFT
jgi:hypothetical protein